jgi:hypothetical protein
MWRSPRKHSNALPIEIKPRIGHLTACHSCGTQVNAHEVLWQGIHICGRYRCRRCGAEYVEDLPVGQAVFTPYTVTADGTLLGDESAKAWFGTPLRDSLKNPSADGSIGFSVEVRRSFRDVVVLNCIDFLYGHCLLKLLNAQAHAEDGSRGLVIIVPSFLRWMVPGHAAEVWEVDIPPGKAQSYFPELDRRISRELERFDSVHVSLAHSHPGDVDISKFTGVPRHDLTREGYRITFVWRADRIWTGNGPLVRALRTVGLRAILMRHQWRKICRLFAKARKSFPNATFTVAGQGREFAFPSWVDDRRTARFDPESEIAACRVYSESRIVIGVHGSNMLLPSAHAGMSIDLMPADRWSNVAQDILYSPDEFGGDPRMASFRHRYIPVETSPSTLEVMIVSMSRSLAAAEAVFHS